MKKKLVSALLAGALVLSTLTGCGGTHTNTENGLSVENEVDEEDSEAVVEASAPKYVFLFIGDGMSYPQIQLTNYFLSASEGQNSGSAIVNEEEKTILSSKNNLTMMDFPVAGSAQTYDSTSFAPDSASTATSILLLPTCCPS